MAKGDWVTTTELADLHGVDRQTIHRLRALKYFEKKKEYKLKNPLAARPTYLYHRQRCLKKLESLEV